VIDEVSVDEVVAAMACEMNFSRMAANAPPSGLVTSSSTDWQSGDGSHLRVVDAHPPENPAFEADTSLGSECVTTVVKP
jgi:hypothetical protein